MLDSTVVCRRALGCEWGGIIHEEVQSECAIAKLVRVTFSKKASWITVITLHYNNRLSPYNNTGQLAAACIRYTSQAVDYTFTKLLHQTIHRGPPPVLDPPEARRDARASSPSSLVRIASRPLVPHRHSHSSLTLVWTTPAESRDERNLPVGRGKACAR